MSDFSKDLIKANVYRPWISHDMVNQNHAFVGSGTKNAAGSTSKELNPSIKALPAILSLPDLNIALTMA
jgi:hypothetical protein